MAQPDLYAQKLLATDPETGFGEATVAPYRKHEFNMTGLMMMGAERTRQRVAAAERQKSNEDFLANNINKLPEYNRDVDTHLNNRRQELVNYGVSSVKQGGNLATDPHFMNALAEYKQDAAASNQAKDDINNIAKAPDGSFGKYVNSEKVKGAALKNYDELTKGVNAGDRKALQKSIAPDLNDLSYFKENEFLHDKTEEFGKYASANDNVINGGLGQFIKHSEKGYKLYTKDAHGNIIPGVDKSVTDYFLSIPTNDPDMLQFRRGMDDLTNKELTNKALFLKTNDGAYKNMGVEEIKDRLQDPKNKYYFNKEAFKEKTLKQKLEPEQSITEKESLRTSHKYSTGSSDKKDEAIARHISLNKIIDGDVTEAGNISGAIYGGNKVLDLKVVPINEKEPFGENGAGGFATKGVLSITTVDSKGHPKKNSVPYKDKEDLYYKMNNIYNTAPGQYKVSKEDLDKNRGNADKIKEEQDPLNLDNEDQGEDIL